MNDREFPPWVHMSPGPLGPIYCAVIAGVCSGPLASASEAITWGQERLAANSRGPVRVSEATARAAWGDRVVEEAYRCAS